MSMSPHRPTPDLPAIIAHRGYAARAPENTLAAIDAAHAAGCRWVELDVQRLGDGMPVIWHDADVSRCSDGHARLRELDWVAAQGLDVGRWFDARFAGERMASLDDALARLAEHGMGLNLELKLSPGHDATALAAVAGRALAALPPERLLISSFDDTLLAQVRRDHPEAVLGWLAEALPDGWLARCRSLDAFSINLDWQWLTRDDAAAVKAAGLHLVCYTANDPAAFAPCSEWGVDAVISDDPARFGAHPA